MKHVSVRWIALIGLLVVVLALLIPARTPAEAKPIKISYATYKAEAEPAVKVIRWFAKELDKRTGGRTETTVFVAGALGNSQELTENIQKGIADMGDIIPAFSPGLFPGAEVLAIPLLVTSAGAQSYIGWDLVNKGYISLEGAKILAVTGHEDIVLATTKKKITTVEDFKGVVLGTNGQWGSFCNKLGASEVALPPFEIYTSVERGVVDGGTFGWSLMTSFKMEPLFKYICSDPFGNDVLLMIMNQKKFNSLPADIQLILVELSREMNSLWTTVTYEENKRSLEHFKAEPGIEVYSLSPKELNRLKELMKPLSYEWAKRLEGKGYPATKVLEIVWQDLRELGLAE